MTIPLGTMTDSRPGRLLDLLIAPAPKFWTAVILGAGAGANYRRGDPGQVGSVLLPVERGSSGSVRYRTSGSSDRAHNLDRAA